MDVSRFSDGSSLCRCWHCRGDCTQLRGYRCGRDLWAALLRPDTWHDLRGLGTGGLRWPRPDEEVIFPVQIEAQRGARYPYETHSDIVW